MAYAIIRIEKRKIGSCAAIEKHHERKKEQYKSNPNIDPALTPLNYHLVQPTKSYRMMALERIEECLSKGSSFTQETTLSGRRTEATAAAAKDKG